MHDINPPNEWDEAAVGPTAADRLRAAWVAAVQDFKTRKTGDRYQYRPGVRLDGGRCETTGRTYKPVWAGLAAGAAEQGLDPVDLVASLFNSRLSGFQPHPQQILSEENVRRCRAAAARVDKTVASALTTEEAVFRSAVWAAGLSTPDRTAAVRFALNDTGRTISPLFRFCAARLYRLDDLAEKWRPAAVAQYRRHASAYAKHWGRILPAEVATA